MIRLHAVSIYIHRIHCQLRERCVTQQPDSVAAWGALLRQPSTELKLRTSRSLLPNSTQVLKSLSLAGWSAVDDPVGLEARLRTPAVMPVIHTRQVLVIFPQVVRSLVPHHINSGCPLQIPYSTLPTCKLPVSTARRGRVSLRSTANRHKSSILEPRGVTPCCPHRAHSCRHASFLLMLPSCISLQMHL